MRLLLYLIFICLFSCNSQQSSLNANVAKQQLKEALSQKKIFMMKVGGNVKNKQIAVIGAEAILFKAYGKTRILSEKPYRIYLIDNYWIISGTSPDELGGAFLIVFSSVNGRIIELTHYK